MYFELQLFCCLFTLIISSYIHVFQNHQFHSIIPIWIKNKIISRITTVQWVWQEQIWTCKIVPKGGEISHVKKIIKLFCPCGSPQPITLGLKLIAEKKRKYSIMIQMLFISVYSQPSHELTDTSKMCALHTNLGELLLYNTLSRQIMINTQIPSQRSCEFSPRIVLTISIINVNT